jgi:hypothetical protein
MKDEKESKKLCPNTPTFVSVGVGAAMQVHFESIDVGEIKPAFRNGDGVAVKIKRETKIKEIKKNKTRNG